MTAPATASDVRIIGRYALHEEIASGGMATVHLGRLLGPAGFSRTVAIKKLHAQYSKDPEFTSMFLDEARLAARIRHQNVVSTLDVVALDGELFIVMDYVEGESLARLLRAAKSRGERVPAPIAIAVMTGALYGLHGAHEAKGEHGESLGLVHRDVSPQNILVDTEGVARVVDFGVAKAVGRLQTTREGQLKGKLAYMAPEQLRGHKVDARTDLFAASVVLWELLTGERLFQSDNEAATFGKILECDVPAPSSRAPGIAPTIDAIVLRGLAAKPDDRWPSALDMAEELERAAHDRPTRREVGRWVRALADVSLAQRANKVRELESHSAVNELVGTPNPLANRPPVSAPLQTLAQPAMPEGLAPATELAPPAPPTEVAPPAFGALSPGAPTRDYADAEPLGVPATLVAETVPMPPRASPEPERPEPPEEPTLSSDSRSGPRPVPWLPPEAPQPGQRATLASGAALEPGVGAPPHLQAPLPMAPSAAAHFPEAGLDERSASLSNLGLARTGTTQTFGARRGLLPAAIGMALALGLALVLAVVILVRSGSREEAVEPGVLPVDEPAAPQNAGAEQPPLPKPAAKPEPAIATPAAPIEPEPPPSASAPKPSTTAKVAPPTPPPAKTTTPKRPNCNPPYTLDKDGTRIPKLECL